MIKLLPLLGAVVFTVSSSFAEVMEEIVVIARQSSSRALQPVISVSHEELKKKGPVAFTDIFSGISSVGIRTNSRGEAVIRLRGSEERQTAIFLDGAPLSIPWDGRVDLSVLPAGIVEQVGITQSAAPIEYGSNAMLGAVEITTVGSCNLLLCDFQLQTGQHGLQAYNAVGGTQFGPLSFMFAGNYQTLTGQPYANKSTIPFAPVSHGERENTDLESRSYWGAVGYEGEFNSLRLSLLSIDASRGIATAGHLNPELKSPRYWRYPYWNLSQLTINTAHSANSIWSLKTTGWYQDFSQTIDQYDNLNYSSVTDREQDKDKTWGLRVVASGDWQYFGVRLVGNHQSTLHRQQDTEFSSSEPGEKVEYQQELYSFGVELDTRPLENISFSLGASYDHSKTPKTGGREPQKAQSDWAGSAALEWQAGPSFTVSATLGRRTRFPSLRELYGASLGKFLLNPNLQPETAWLGDMTLRWYPQNEAMTLSITPWATKVKNTLSKRRVVTDDALLDQRYNMKGAEGYGLDFSVNWNATDKLHIDAGGSWQSLEAKKDNAGVKPEILQRPRYQASITVDYAVTSSFSSRLMVQRTGEAKDIDWNGEVVSLGSSSQLDAKLYYSLDTDWQLVMTLENITNAVVLPQLGLPSAGRMLSFTVQYSVR